MLTCQPGQRRIDGHRRVAGRTPVRQPRRRRPHRSAGARPHSAVNNPPKRISGQAVLNDNGKPLIVYIGAEYCPYCAAERWAAVIALSRFGTFTGLGQTHSSSSDVYPDTATLSFHGAVYASQYL
jgi:thiol-disulfide isomerase/thioredoxin